MATFSMPSSARRPCLRRQLEAKLGEYRQVLERLTKWKDTLARRASDRLLLHQVEEIEQARLRPGEDEELEQERRALQMPAPFMKG